ncbi:MAG: tetratricopeptide repeat protein [Alkalinema sp. RU_4_3]|nr:tetratricopeptide repeat protein [Alkalinema sp. RU_4_3]
MIDTGRIPLTGEALTWYRQGLACSAKGELEKAVAFYNQVIHERPDFWEAWFERGLALGDLGLYGERSPPTIEPSASPTIQRQRLIFGTTGPMRCNTASVTMKRP